MAGRRPLTRDPIEVRGNTAFERGLARTNHNSKAACADRRIERYSIVLIRNATLRRVGNPSENLRCRNRGAELTGVNDCRAALRIVIPNMMAPVCSPNRRRVSSGMAHVCADLAEPLGMVAQ